MLANLTEAAWAGYARQLVGTTLAAYDNAGEAYKFPAANPVFLNTSGVSQNFVGWFLVDPTGAVLLGYGSLSSFGVVLPNGGRYQLAPAWVEVGT